MYGIMFGTTSWPEQFSPHEWRTMRIPFATGARVYFHACRTGRWFASFFANTFGVRTFGHFWYTTVSLSPTRFVPELLRPRSRALHIIASTGRKSHGLVGSIYKYLAWPPAHPMVECEPSADAVDRSYDPVADLYDTTFADIRVRADEWKWLLKQQDALRDKDVLDIGCGNGAFLSQLSGLIRSGNGVDSSQGMIAKAVERCAGQANLAFETIDGPTLPYPDDSFDTVMSVLSFRYLDWDPLVREILRVLRPGGELLVVDMVASALAIADLPAFVRGKLSYLRQRTGQREYYQALSRMVTDPRWKQMLTHNPIRAEHELRWYLESRFPGNMVETINVGFRSKILAFRSGPVVVKSIAEMQYP